MKSLASFWDWRATPKGSLIFGALALLGLILLMFGDLIVTGRQVLLSDPSADLASQFFYWREFAANEIKHGHLPLWNPHVFSGMPFLGWSQTGVLYPLNWLDLVLPLPCSINLSVALHVYLAGVFTYWWTLRRGLHPLAGVVAGAVFMFGGAFFLHVRAGHLSVLAAVPWIPLLFVAIDGFFQSRGGKWVLLGMFAVGMQVLAGDFQVVFYTAIAASVYSCCCLIGAKERIKIALGLAGMYVGAGLLGAVQLFTSYQATSESVRSGPLAYAFASMLSLPPENLLTLIAPGFFGDSATMPYWGRWYYWEACLFVGVTGLILLVRGAARGDRRLKRFSSTTALVLLVLALGSHTPLFEVFYRWVPGFDRFRATAKFIAQASLFMAMLAGIGLDQLIQHARNHRRLAVGLLIGGGVLALASLYGRSQAMTGPPSDIWPRVLASLSATQESYLPSRSYTDPEFVRQAGLFACHSLAISTGILALLGGLVFASEHWKGAIHLIALLAVAEIFAFGRHQRRTFDLASIQSASLNAFLDQHPGDYRFFYVRNGNVAMGLHRDDVWGYAPLALKRYAEFMAFTQGQSPEGATQYVHFSRVHPLFSMLRCQFVFFPTNAADRVLEAGTVMPRVQLIRQYRVLPGRDAILATMNGPSFDPRKEVLLETEPDPMPARSTESGRARITGSSCNQLTIEADLPQPAILLVTDAYSNGWRARPLPGSVQNTYRVMPANYILRAIPLARGHHHFCLEYRPRAFEIGMWISLVSGLVYLLAVGWHLKGRRFA